jgi:hypothetical protein
MEVVNQQGDEDYRHQDVHVKRHPRVVGGIVRRDRYVPYVNHGRAQPLNARPVPCHIRYSPIGAAFEDMRSLL